MKIWSSFDNLLQKIDVFKIPVSLNYQKQTSFKTSFGGIISLFFYSMIGVSIVMLVTTMVSKSRFTINRIESSTYSYYNNTKHYFLRGTMMMGFKVNIISDNPMATSEIYPYVYINRYEFDPVTNKRKDTDTYVPLTLGNSSMFDPDVYKEQKILLDEYYCPTNPEDLYVLGSESTYESTYIGFELYKKPGSTCVSLEEFYDSVYYARMRVFIQTPYLDFNDLDNPLKTKTDV